MEGHQGCHSRVPTLPSPQRTALLSRALPTRQAEGLEPAPSPSELFIGVFSCGAAVLE